MPPRHRLPALLLIAGLVAACTGPGAGPVPEAARLSATGLELQTSDGRTCRGPRPEGGEVWQGRVQGCRVDWPYTAELTENLNPLARLVRAVFRPLGIDETLAMAGRVRVDLPDGRVFVFESPPPPPDSDLPGALR